jgi:hypothetical protein
MPAIILALIPCGLLRSIAHGSSGNQEMEAMLASDTILLSVEVPIATVTLNRSDPLNPLSRALSARMTEMFATFQAMPDFRIAIDGDILRRDNRLINENFGMTYADVASLARPLWSDGPSATARAAWRE